MSNDRTDTDAWTGRTAVDRDGDKIGDVTDVYLDDYSGEPEWLAVSTGWFGNKVSFVPIAGARGGDDVAVAYDKATVKGAPSFDPDGHLSEEEEEALYRHYGLDYEAGRDGEHVDRPVTGDPAPAAAGDDRDAGRADAVTRSEEEMDVGTVRREAGRVRLRKHVVTDHVTRTVPVQREEVRIEREPIEEGAPAGDLSEGTAEVVLHEEEAVVDKRVVAREQVRVGKEVVTEEQEVSADLAKEQIDVERKDPNRRS